MAFYSTNIQQDSVKFDPKICFVTDGVKKVLVTFPNIDQFLIFPIVFCIGYVLYVSIHVSMYFRYFIL